MAEIKRYNNLETQTLEGEWVKHSDHEAAIRAAVEAERAGCVYAAAEGIRDRQHYDGPLNDQYDLLDSEAEKIIAAILARGAAHD